jgi:uncharacterized protein (TIGR02598 family)
MKANIIYRTRGFSLVETVLAIGIMGLAITALLGLLPHGLEMTKQAGDENAYARIIESVRTELMRHPFATVARLADTSRMQFDEQGMSLSVASGGQQAYVAQIDYRGPNESAITLTGGNAAHQALHNFAVHIAASPQVDFNFKNRPPRSYRTYPVVIARNF